MHSPGRQPRVYGTKTESPRGATDFRLRRKPQAPSEEHLPPLRGSDSIGRRFPHKGFCGAGVSPAGFHRHQ